jgi:GalNAc-alpha-(1->4)-GalNAc-alpha-(1->3)-diNAcBac-PP-undecaprenol alpha-1,4-N-acetyl-D-galactosaminyltransferase
MVWLANQWSAAGHTVQLVTLANGRPDCYETVSEVERLRIGPSPKRWYQLWSQVTRLKALRRWILRYRPDVIVSFLPKANAVVTFAAWSLPIPVVVSERTSLARDVTLGKNILRRIVFQRASVVVTHTVGAANATRRLRPAGSIRAIPNPMIAGLPDAAYGPNDRVKLILSVGRLEWVKGFDRLVAAFSRVAVGLPGWRLAILGDGSERNRLAAQAAKSGVGGLVDLPGRTTDPLARMREAAVFVLPSRYEGFGNVLIEAMTCGSCVVAFDCPEGPAEIITQRHDGILVPDGDVAALCRAIESVCLDRDERERLGRNARESARRFEPGRVLCLWNSLLAEVTSCGDARRRGDGNRVR